MSKFTIVDTWSINDYTEFSSPESLVIRKLGLGLCGWYTRDREETEILHSGNSSQLGDYYSFFSLCHTQYSSSTAVVFFIFFIVVWEDNKEWEGFSWVSIDLPSYGPNRKFTAETENDVLLFFSLQAFVLD